MNNATNFKFAFCIYSCHLYSQTDNTRKKDLLYIYIQKIVCKKRVYNPNYITAIHIKRDFSFYLLCGNFTLVFSLLPPMVYFLFFGLDVLINCNFNNNFIRRILLKII